MMRAVKRVLIASVAALLFCAGAVCAQCPTGDLNQDCTVDLADLELFARLWLADPNETGGDFNADRHTNAADLALLAAHWRRTGCPIVINEILAHSHDVAPDWIELYNVSSLPVDISGWQLSDDKNELDKHVIADGTVVGPFGYIVFYEHLHFGNPFHPGTRTPFALSENGEALYLTPPEDSLFGDCPMVQEFGASTTGNSFGRYMKSDRTCVFVTQSRPTPGLANADPLVGPLVINEIMYHPAVDGDAEYVELLNISPGFVTLFDYVAMEPWRFADESGIDFWFPSDVPVTLWPFERIVLARSADAVRSGVPATVRIFEWGSGKLSNRGEEIRLLKPGDVDEAGTRYWIEVDRVEYSDGSRGEDFPDYVDPWPAEADGLGPSLNRIFPSRYGDDPNNWHATIPTPGSAND